MTIGERIKKRRTELDLSQEEVANELGYKSRTSVFKVEQGITDLHESIGIAPATIAKMGRGEFVSMEVLYRIAISLNVDFGDLVAINRKNEEK